MSIRILHVSETREAFRRASLLIGDTRYDIEFIEFYDTALTIADDDMEDNRVESELWQIKIEGSDNLKIRISPHCPWRPREAGGESIVLPLPRARAVDGQGEHGHQSAVSVPG